MPRPSHRDPLIDNLGDLLSEGGKAICAFGIIPISWWIVFAAIADHWAR